MTGAVSPQFTPPNNAVGGFTYYVEVVNTIPDNGDGGIKRAPVYGFAGKTRVYDLLDLSIPPDAGAGAVEYRGKWRFSPTDGTYILENGCDLVIIGSTGNRGHGLAGARNAGARVILRDVGVVNNGAERCAFALGGGARLELTLEGTSRLESGGAGGP